MHAAPLSEHLPLGPISTHAAPNSDGSYAQPSGWNLKILQTTSGRLSVDATELSFDGVQLMLEDFQNVVTNQYGCAPDNAICIGVSTAMTADGLFNGKAWRNGTCLFDSRREIDSVVPPSQLFGAVIDRHLLSEYLLATEGLEIEPLLRKGSVVHNDPRISQQLAAAITRIHDLAQEADLSCPIQQKHLQNLTLEMIGPAIAELFPAIRKTPYDGHLPKIVQQARDHVMKNIRDPILVIDLCRELGLTRTSLQVAFNEVLGTSPLRYLRAMRLNGARERLSQGDDTLMIKQVADEYGFWHLSRFSQDYRQMFGELPSETLRNARTPWTERRELEAA